MDEILRRDDAQELISNIKYNEKYYIKTSTDSDMYYSDDIALYVFYEALLKYYIIFDDTNYLGEYIYDIDLLYRKIDTIEDIRFGISKIIVKFSSKYLHLEEENRGLILSFIYSNYVVNGYLIHGFSSVYSDDILDNGFKLSDYYNFYDDFIKLNEIFKKYEKDNFIDKDFVNKEIFFTDDILKSCIYSINSPMYFSKLLTNNEIINDKEIDYYKDNYDECIKHFNKIINTIGFNEEEKTFALDLINKEWDLLHKKDKTISLLLVKRKLFDIEDVNLEDIIDSDLDINEAVDRILTIRYKDIPFDKDIDAKDLRVINYEIVNREKLKEIKEEEKEEKKLEEKQIKNDDEDSYGVVSPLMLVGSLLISLGVILSIISVWGG